MVRKEKEVTWRSLKKGQTIKGYKRGSTRSFFTAVVESANASAVTYLKWGSEREQISSEETMFTVVMTDEEFEAMYASEAVEVMKALSNRLAEYEIGCHEMYNAWIRYNPYEMAAECKERKMKLIGVCEEIIPKRNMFNHNFILDIGICAEEKDGSRIWCHASKEYLNRMFEDYGHLTKKETSHG